MAFLYRNKECCLVDIADEIKITYSYINKIINTLDQRRFTQSVKKGRKRVVTLTRKGFHLAKSCNQVIIGEEI